MSAHRGWIGCDLDGTLAEYHAWNGGEIGPPVPRMLARVKRWLSEGRQVRIVTARVAVPRTSDDAELAINITRALHEEEKIKAWCLEHIGQLLPVTSEKDFAMVTLYADRCVQVIPNTGERADGREE